MADENDLDPEASDYGVSPQTKMGESYSKLFKESLTRGTNAFVDDVSQSVKLTEFFARSYVSAFMSLSKEDPVNIAATQTQLRADLEELKASDPKRAREELESLSREYTKYALDAASTLQTISGLSARAVESTEFGINSVTSRVVRNTMDMTRDVLQSSVTLIDGMSVHYADLLQNPEEMVQNFKRAVLDESTTFYAVSRDMSADMIRTNNDLMMRLGLSTQDIGQMIQLEFSATGKASGKVMEDFQKTILAAAEMGMNIPNVTKDVLVMMDNVRLYGEMTTDQMASLSNTISHLGLSLGDVTKMADKFSSFDSAIDVVNKLTAATGATLDTMKLFELSASGDIEGFVDELKAQFEDAGVEYESLNRLQKNMLASSLSIEPEILQRMMNDNIQSVDSVAASISSKAGAITKEEAQKRFASMDQIAALPDPEKYSEKYARISRMSLDTAKEVENVNSAIAGQIALRYDVANKGQSSMGEASNALAKVASNAATKWRELTVEMRNSQEVANLIATSPKSATRPGGEQEIPVKAIAPTAGPAITTTPPAAISSPAAQAAKTPAPTPTPAPATPTTSPPPIRVEIVAAPGTEKYVTFDHIEHGIDIGDRHLVISTAQTQRSR